MVERVFINLILILTVSIQLAHSLKCFTCIDPSSCPRPQIVQCNQQSASAMRNSLEIINHDIPNLFSDEFACLVDRYGSNNQTEIDFRGCITKGAYDCETNLFRMYKTKQLCSVCQKDLCNSVATICSNIGITITLLIIAKMFVI